MKVVANSLRRRKREEQEEEELSEVILGAWEDEEYLRPRVVDLLWPTLVDDFTHGALWPCPKSVCFLPELYANVAAQRPDLCQRKPGVVVGLRKSEGLLRFRPVGVVNKQYLQPLIHQRVQEIESRFFQALEHDGDYLSSASDDEILVSSPLPKRKTQKRSKIKPWKKKRFPICVTPFFGLEHEGKRTGEQSTSSTEVDHLDRADTSWLDWFWPKVGFPPSSLFFSYPFEPQDEPDICDYPCVLGTTTSTDESDAAASTTSNNPLSPFTSRSTLHRRNHIINAVQSELPKCHLRWGEDRIIRDDGYPPLFLSPGEMARRLTLAKAYGISRANRKIELLRRKHKRTEHLSTKKRAHIERQLSALRVLRTLVSSDSVVLHIFYALMQKGVLLLDMSYVYKNMLDTVYEELQSVAPALEKLFCYLFGLTGVTVKCHDGMSLDHVAKKLKSKGRRVVLKQYSEDASFTTSECAHSEYAHSEGKEGKEGKEEEEGSADQGKKSSDSLLQLAGNRVQRHRRNRSMDVRASFGFLKEKIKMWKEGAPGQHEARLERSSSLDSLVSPRRNLDLSFGDAKPFAPDFLEDKYKWVVGANVLIIDGLEKASTQVRSLLCELLIKGEAFIPGHGLFSLDPSAQNDVSADTIYFVAATVYTEPTVSLETEILERFTLNYTVSPEVLDAPQDSMDENDPPKNKEGAPFTPRELLAFQTAVSFSFLADDLVQMMNDMITWLRNHQHVKRGVSLTASTSFYSAVRARAIANGRTFVTPSDVQNVAKSALAHHIVLRRLSNIKSPHQLVDMALRTIKVPV